MVRSFTDRILGGVCGGLGELLPVSAWLLRIVFVLLSVVTLGAFALLYLALWLLVPQDSPVMPPSRSPLLLLLALMLAVGTLLGWLSWVGGGFPLYWPGLLLVLSTIYLLRQIGG